MVLPPKFPGFQTDGYWGESVHQRINDEQIAAKIRTYHQDKIVGSQSPPVILYLPVSDADALSVPCSCVKETASRGDARCRTCHMTKRAPGFRRFLHETIYACSSSIAGFTLVNVEEDLEGVLPIRLRLSGTAVTGTIVTPDIAFTNPDNADWETELVAYRIQPTDTALAEFSTDAGVTWTNVTAINGANRPIGTGVVRFRITLTRALGTTESPSFEIIRARHPYPSRVPIEMRVLRPDVIAGDILVLHTWTLGITGIGQTYARQTDHNADRSWTLPLDYFDTTITRDTPAAKVDDTDDEQAAHPFYVHRRGINAGTRYVIFQFSYNETLGLFSHQAFAERKAQRNEGPYSLVW